MDRSTYLQSLKALIKVWETSEIEDEEIIAQVDLLGEQWQGEEEPKDEFAPEEDSRTSNPEWTTKEKEGWK